MPKRTFYNLPKEKQQVIVRSAKKEFSRVPFNKALISNIVKNADIPRGSFYQYFKDKEDAFFYLLKLKTKVHQNEFINILNRNNGNIFDTFIENYQNMLMTFQKKENREFFKNVFLNMNYKMERKILKEFRYNVDNFPKQLPRLLTHIDWEKINIINENELIHVIQIIVAVTLQNLVHNFARKYTFDEALENYIFEINLLKKGLYKKDSY